jgi:hypothetical protein
MPTLAALPETELSPYFRSDLSGDAHYMWLNNPDFQMAMDF